ncbi:MAG: adenosylmethionine--8-amino-7-oxononanoate transaminase [Bacteroidia bacterium]|nr:adenosylmethionine--8-amino-7-oxononanoate transaminase [Bacteroidia bacterium]MDW8133809.1 adenosylmethionine--8-amino-7-oxononanoate transaminase [Bacteroidia bacterium]
MPIWRPYTIHCEGLSEPLRIVRAQGSYLYTDEGRALWDGTCAWWVTIHGHCHPFIAEAIANQALTLDQVLFADFTHPLAEALVEKLAKLTGLSWGFFSDDGSTAVEVAIKVALQYFYNQGEKRNRILALEGAYHGDTFGAMSVSHRTLFTQAFREFLFEVEWIPFPRDQNEANLLNILNEIAQRKDIAAFIGEPLLQGTAGMRPYASHYWDWIAGAVRKAGGLIIADEVFTGFGRTGTLFAVDQCKEKPDILCLAKGLTGGFLPLGLTLVSEKVFEAFYSPEPSKALYHGHSYTANPIACAAALANLTLWEQPDTVIRYRNLVRKQAELADLWRARYPAIPAWSIGPLFAVALPTPAPGYFAEHRYKLKSFAMERGIFLRPLGNIAYILPALSSLPEELERAVEVVEAYTVETGISV